MNFVAGLIIVALITLFILVERNGQAQAKYQSLVQNLKDIESSMLMFRRHEKDFLARLSVKYQKRHQDMRQGVTLQLQKIDRLASELDEVWPEDKVVEQFNRYYQSFDKMSANYVAIGLDEKSGLRGALRAAIHQVEASVKAENNAKLLVDILMLRRHEKDFLLRNDIKYLGRHDKQILATVDDIKQLNRSNSQALIAGLFTYQQEFQNLVKATQEVGLDSNSGLKGEMRSAVHNLESILNQEIARLESETIAHANSLNQQTTIAFVSICGLLMFVMISISRHIINRSQLASKLVSELQQKVASKQLSGLGQLKMAGKDEFALISSKTAQLGHEIEVLYEQIAQEHAKTTRIKQALDTANTPVMLTNTQAEVIYFNQSFSQLAIKLESAIQAFSSKFSAANLLGSNINQLIHTSSETSHQDQSAVVFGEYTVSINTAEIIGENQQKLGTVYEWLDKTEELRLQELEKLKQQQERILANENARIRQSLDVASTSVMVADDNLQVIYHNKSMAKLMSKLTHALSQLVAGFQVNQLEGYQLNQFSWQPQKQLALLQGLTQVHNEIIEVAGNTLEVNIAPIFNEQGEKLGFVVEWHDLTAELAQQAKEREAAYANARIRQSLDVANTPVMVANADNEIIYTNHSIDSLMLNIAPQLQSVIKDFDPRSLLGSHIDKFHTEPAHQQAIISQLTDTYQTKVEVNGLTLSITATPITSDDGERIGTVVEWQDLTQELARQAKEREIANENARIRQSLDVANTAVMVADNDLNVIYTNQSLQHMMLELESSLANAVQGFNAKQLLGHPVNLFSGEVAEQHKMLMALQNTYQTQVEVSDLTFAISAAPIINQDNERIGTVIEWRDLTKQLARQVIERRIADENARIKAALDNVSTNAMVADDQRNIVYLNKSMMNMFTRNQQKLKQVLPEFDIDNLVGQSIDVFHRNPAHQEQLLQSLTAEYQSEIVVNGLTFELTANPVFTESGERIGSVLEWLDRTDEVAIEEEIDTLIAAAARGDLEQRIDLQNKETFFLKLGTGLNELVAIAQDVVNETGRVLAGMAQGDLSQSIDKDYQGAFGQLKQDANMTTQKLTEITQGISQSALSVSNGANEIAQGNLNLSQRTEQQAASLEETAASMDEMTSSVQQSASHADEANQLSRLAQQRAEKGGEVVQNAIHAMDEINQASNEIVDIIGTIDEIAFQTNLLALNAAVEAARAGEQGRGFAVVAGEVRNLAQRSAESAKKIKQLIQNSVTKVAQGSEMVNESGRTLSEIIDTVRQVNDIVQNISHSANEQSRGIVQVNQAVVQMDEMTQQNAALVEQATAASSAMAEQARQMQDLVNFFNSAKVKSAMAAIETF
ncbi:diguanylate cyclase [Saccharobesus litoralis]|uniref:Diguanylate cyclase n=2 Tax=Saccharobesus litoralis TaxID=2172099 RepID=A0A2S0VMC3_9ALTE|nr:diguanylate cyclase [Saccharobesus litoralis]